MSHVENQKNAVNGLDSLLSATELSKEGKTSKDVQKSAKALILELEELLEVLVQSQGGGQATAKGQVGNSSKTQIEKKLGDLLHEIASGKHSATKLQDALIGITSYLSAENGNLDNVIKMAKDALKGTKTQKNVKKQIDQVKKMGNELMEAISNGEVSVDEILDNKNINSFFSGLSDSKQTVLTKDLTAALAKVLRGKEGDDEFINDTVTILGKAALNKTTDSKEIVNTLTDSSKLAAVYNLSSSDRKSTLGAMKDKAEGSSSNKDITYQQAMFELGLCLQQLLGDVFRGQADQGQLMNKVSSQEMKNAKVVMDQKISDLNKEIEKQKKAEHKPWWMWLIGIFVAIAGAIAAAFTGGAAACVVAVVIGSIMASPLGDLITSKLITAIAGDNPTDAQTAGATAAATAIITIIATILSCGAGGFSAAADGAAEGVEQGVTAAIESSATQLLKGVTTGIEEALEEGVEEGSEAAIKTLDTVIEQTVEDVLGESASELGDETVQGAIKKGVKEALKKFITKEIATTAETAVETGVESTIEETTEEVTMQAVKDAIKAAEKEGAKKLEEFVGDIMDDIVSSTTDGLSNGVKGGVKFTMKALTKGLLKKFTGSFLQGFIGSGGLTSAVEAVMYATPEGKKFLDSDAGAGIMCAISIVAAIGGSLAAGSLANSGVEERASFLKINAAKDPILDTATKAGNIIYKIAQYAQKIGALFSGAAQAGKFVIYKELADVKKEIGKLTALSTMQKADINITEQMVKDLSSTSQSEEKHINGALRDLLNSMDEEGKNQVDALTS